MSQRVLDRLVQFDERSRQYPVRTLVAAKAPRSYTWSCKSWLDQGREGACVGFAWNHEINARPKPHNIDIAHTIYKEAQKVDEWAGEQYEGTSVLAGVKVAEQLGYVKEYRWSFGLDDLILAVGYAGPAVLGINWYSDMFNTDEKGYVHVSGTLSGGHAILCNGVNVKEKYFKLHNSWGRDWGKDGEARISFDDMNRLIHEQGEACIITKRGDK